METVPLAAGERFSRVLPVLVPDSDGQIGGYVRINSNEPLIGQMVFGSVVNGRITLFSAVPPTVIQ